MPRPCMGKAPKRSVSPLRDHALDARLEQIAQAVELRLQTQDSQIVHMCHQLELERRRADKAVETVEAQVEDKVEQAPSSA